MNRRKNSHILAVLWAVVLVVGLVGPAAADTHYVNSGQSIQAAIDAAANGDEIEAAPGVYNEAINFKGKAVKLYSGGGREETIIDATGLGISAVTCAGGEGPDTMVEGFTITGGRGTLIAEMAGNRYYVGGGMYNDQSSPTVSDCNFTGNSVNYFGGGMWNDQSSPIVTSCSFSGNSAHAGGGVFNCNDSLPVFTHCIFAGNSADKGGGMYNFSDSSPTVANCNFTGNTAASDAYGDGGGMFNEGSSSPTVANCTFSSNSASRTGGGMLNHTGSNPNLAYCTFIGNKANTNGGAISNWDSSPTVTNCILWADMPDEIHNSNSIATVSYSDVQAGWSGAGNINTDPCFVDTRNPDPSEWNLHLKPDSPCIDAGDTTAVSLPLDMDGHPRALDVPYIPNSGQGIGSLHVVDMGAYEFQPCQIPGDNNCDGAVDFKDLAILCNNWLAGAEGQL